MKIDPATVVPLLSIAERAIHLGARPPVVKDLAKGLPSEVISSMYRQIRGAPPPKGKLPITTSFFTQSNLYRTHSTLLMRIHKQLKALGVLFPYSYLDAHELYVHTVGGATNARLTFDRSWHLMRMMGIDKDLHEVTCPDCGCEFVAHVQDPLGALRDLCPAHRLKQLSTSQEIAEKRLASAAGRKRGGALAVH